MLTPSDLKALFDRYLNGQATVEERALVESWFLKSGNAEKEDLLLSDDDKSRLLNRMHARMGSSGSAPGAPVRRMFAGWWVAAASVVVLLAGWGLWRKARTAGDTAALRAMAVRTRQGELRRMVLPDGTGVWVNANTLLRYPADFTGNRQVELDGEALFDVKKDAAHPFEVRTADGIVTRVLGTQFDIRSYARYKETRVSVLSGKVQVGKDTLTRQQSVRYDAANGSYQKNVQENTDLSVDWTKGQWDFENMDVVDLEILMNNRFGIDVEDAIRDSSHVQTHVSVNFTKSQGPQEIVEIFCTLANCKCHWVNDKQVRVE